MTATSGNTATQGLGPFFAPWAPEDRDDWGFGAAVIGAHAGLKTELQYVWVLSSDGKKLYPQPVKLEVPGNVNAVYRLDTGQIGFVEVERGLLPVENVPAWKAARAAGYFDMSLVVRIKLLELSRKFAKDPAQAAKAAAEAGAEQETGTAVIGSQLVGWMYGNSTFEVQPTAVHLVLADPTQVGRYAADPWDQIVNGGTVWLDRAQVDEYTREGRIMDGFTNAAIRVLDAHMPGLRR